MSAHQDTASDCGCSPAWRKPKPNGTCATCGGWLPGERLQSLTAMWAQTEPEPCPMGCGFATEDPYGGPCSRCWDEIS